MRIPLLTVLFLLSYSIASSQSLSQRVITSGGNLSESSNFKLSYSVGEIFISEYQTTNTIITAGFQQGVNGTVSVDEITDNLDLKVYPNPVKDFLMLQLADIEYSTLFIEIISMKGDVLLSKKVEGLIGDRIEIMNISKLPAGLLILRVRTDNFKKVKTVPIIKN